MAEPGGRLWLWEGWVEGEEPDPALLHKLALLRVFAMKTTAALAEARGAGSAWVVYAGLEPAAFRALFPAWTGEEEAAAFSRGLGRAAGKAEPLGPLLAAAALTTHPLAALRTRPLPPGVDAARLEDFLSDADFAELFAMPRADFAKLPAWKRTRAKQEARLF